VLPLYLEASFGVTERTFGFFLAYFGVLSLVMRILLLGPIVDRLGERGTVRVGCVVLMLGCLLYPAPGSLPLLAILVMPLVPIGTALLFPSTTSLISASTPRHELGVTMGVAQTFAGLARVIAPLFATKVFQDFGHGWPFIASAALVLLVGLLAVRVEPSPDEPAPDPAPAGTPAR
jgi:MFS family permease